MLPFVALAIYLSSAPANAQVIAAGPNGPTNPSAPLLDGYYNQISVSRLVTLNSIDDFCLWGPPVAGPENTIGAVEPIVVSWCTKPRNGARLIPDGTITSAHFVKTPSYVQISGQLDGTRLNILNGDAGGELDPHGAEGTGNPIGGNVTSNVSGQDIFYEEWMSFMSYNQYCLRICTSENSTYSAAIMCQHELDVMGCQFVMPGNYDENSFTSCDADAAYPPGVYPIGSAGSGTTSTFHQRYTNTVPGNEWTIGVTVTPASAYSMPASSNCVTRSSISNGVNIIGSATITGSVSVNSAAAAVSTASFTSITSTNGAAAASRTSRSRSDSVMPTPTPSVPISATSSAIGSMSRVSASQSSFNATSALLWALLTVTILVALTGGVVVF